MKIEKIILSLGLFLFVILIACFVAYDFANSICIETQMKPIRWQSQGLFKVPTAIPTTIDNMDELREVCIKTRESSFFSLFENMDFIINYKGKNREVEKK